ncbi:MAG: cobalamin-dependent protein [Gammaproteobacteria bacterium]|nr:cobalamin-dependent protein [Gammaproteobacteria bacterium]MDH5311344.1 cobalamin-dependent protein [Gammaproteobacteria bacterium]
MTDRQPKILISKLGLDGHDRGAKLVAHALREAGFDVVFLGIRHTVPEVVDAAISEDVDYAGLSFLAGDHMTLVPKVLRELDDRGAGGVRLIVGGIILKEQVPELLSMGVRKVFLPGTPLKVIEEFIREDAKQ